MKGAKSDAASEGNREGADSSALRAEESGSSRVRLENRLPSATHASGREHSDRLNLRPRPTRKLHRRFHQSNEEGLRAAADGS